MASPEWPKFEFKDGRKRMTTLPIIDTRGNEQGNQGDITPRPFRLNSTESALKRAKTDGGNDMTTPRPPRPNSTESIFQKEKTGERKDMTPPMPPRPNSTESVLNTVKTDRGKDMTTPMRFSPSTTGCVLQKMKTAGGKDMSTPRPSRPISTASTFSAFKRSKTDGGKGSTSRLSSSNRRKSNKEGEWMCKESTQREIKLRRSINSFRETIPDTVPERRPETLIDTVPDSPPETIPHTVPENPSTNVGRLSIDSAKKSGTLIRSLENVKSGGKKEKEKLPNLPDPLSALMLERDESVRKEMEAKKRKEEQTKRKDAVVFASASGYNIIDSGEEGVPGPSKPRKKSLLDHTKKKSIGVPQRRFSLHSRPIIPDISPVTRRDTTVIDGRQKSTVARRMSVSPSGGLRDDKGKRKQTDDERAKMMRRSTEGGGSTGWISPSLQDFRPAWKQARRSTETGKEKETTVPVTRKITSVVPASPMGSEKDVGDGGGQRRVSLTPSHLISPSAADFTPKNGRKKSRITSVFFGEKTKEKEQEKEVVEKVKPQSQLSWGRLASALYRKTSVPSEVSIGSTVPGEFEEEEVEQERERERMNSLASTKSGNSDGDVQKPSVNRFISSISLATTRGPSSTRSEADMQKTTVNRFLSSISLATTRGPSSTCSVVYDSMEEQEEEPNNGFKPMIIDDDLPPDEFEIKDTVQEGAPKEIKFTKSSGLGLFRRPLITDLPTQDRPSSSFSPPPPSRHSSGGSITSANPRGKRIIGANYEDKLSKQLDTALELRRSDRRLLKHDNSSIASLVLTVEKDRSSGWGVSMISHSRGHLLLPSNTAPPEGSCVRVALPLSCVLDSVAVAPIVL